MDFLQNNDLSNLDMNMLLGSQNDVNSAKNLFENQDMVKLVETYLDVEVPEKFKNHPIISEFWAIQGKNIKLTFLENSDVEDFEILFEQSILNYLMSKPAYQYTFEDEQILDQFRLFFIAALKRSVGTGQHKFNERIILGGTINQVIRSNTEAFNAGQMGGGGGARNFFKRFF